MSQGEIFKTEFKGYSKSQVLEYIEDLNTEMQALKSKLDIAESELEKCRVELEDTQPSAMSEEDIEELKAQIYSQARAELRAEIEAEFAQNTDEPTVEIGLDDVHKKAAMYDEQKDILAELMIKAKSDAAAIYAEAENKSVALMEDAFDKFNKMREDFEQMRRNVGAAKTEIDARVTNITRYLDDFNQYLNIMEKDITNTGDNFKREI